MLYSSFKNLQVQYLAQGEIYRYALRDTKTFKCWQNSTVSWLEYKLNRKIAIWENDKKDKGRERVWTREGGGGRVGGVGPGGKMAILIPIRIPLLGKV